MRKCISSFATADGKVVAAGEFVEDNDPVIAGHEVFFAGVSDPVKAPEVEARQEEDIMPENTEPTRTPNVNGVNPVDPPPVDDDDPRLHKENGEEVNDNDRAAKPAASREVEEATAEPGGRRSTSRTADTDKGSKGK